MAVLSRLIIPALVMEERAQTPQVRATGIALNWLIWLAFVADFGVRWAADGRSSFPNDHGSIFC